MSIRSLVRRLRAPWVRKGRWVMLRVPTTLPDGRVVPAGRPVQIVEFDPVDGQLVVDVPGFGTASGEPVVGTMARIKVARRDVGTMWRNWGV